jgi:uncharacterized spore protein YtfJ
MNNNVNDLMAKLTDFLKNEAKTETVIGQQFQLGEFNCVPVIGVGFGLGAAGNANKAKGDVESEAGGAGVGMAPIGFLISKGDHIQFLSARPASGLSTAFEQVPLLLDKYLASKKEAAPAV